MASSPSLSPRSSMLFSSSSGLIIRTAAADGTLMNPASAALIMANLMGVCESAFIAEQVDRARAAPEEAMANAEALLEKHFVAVEKKSAAIKRTEANAVAEAVAKVRAARP